MQPIRVFFSSVHRELARERKHLRDFLQGAQLMRRYFEVIFFDDAQDSDARPSEIDLDEIERCEVYVGLFGAEYGIENENGVSTIERAFDRASELGLKRIVLVMSAEEGKRDPKIQALLSRVQAGVERWRYNTPAELIAALYAALVEHLEAQDLLSVSPFDAAQCSGAALDDLDIPGMYRFVRAARQLQGLALPEDTTPSDVLRHLSLLKRGRLTNAAVLLFGKAPQRFLISSEIKCAHFHGYEVTRPIPFYQVLKGTVFQLVDQAVDFVMGKIDRSIGTRANSVQAPATYEIPIDVVTEAIVNAVAHRDYTDNSSIHVMLFADRLEITYPGLFPSPLNADMLSAEHCSLPTNPLIAESMYLLRYMDSMESGTAEMSRWCAELDLRKPEFEASSRILTRTWRPKRSWRRPVPNNGSSQDVRSASNRTTQETCTTTQESRGTSQETDVTTQETGETSQETGVTPQEIGETIQETDRTTQEMNVTSQEMGNAASFSTQDRIVAHLRNDPTLTRVALSNLVGITPDGIKYHLDKLRRAGRIRHTGPNRKGYWEFLESGKSRP